MDQDQSATALWVAALRALHQTAEHPPLLVDPLAERILGPEAAAVLARYRSKAGDSAALRATLAIRSVVAEEAIDQAATRGVTQYVILGAGLDTFAYRQTNGDLVVFEVDRPAMQDAKRSRLDGAGIPIPPSVRYVPVDVARDDLFAALMAAGFDPTHPAVFAMLGVVLYLPRATLVAVLRAIASRSAASSEIVFDYTAPFDQAEAPIRSAYQAAAARVAASGEPWVSYFEPIALHALLGECGLEVVEDLDAAALHRRFCAGRADGLSPTPFVHLVRARV